MGMVRYRQRTVCQECGKPARDDQQWFLNRNLVRVCSSCGTIMRPEWPKFTLYTKSGKRRC